MRANRTNKKHGGFTLIELSIVLVVIGLIVGGILMGQSLISAAAVRAQISQIEKYNTAANTFREKYGYLPGDITATAASQFGFAARGPCPGEGDGNGIIQGSLLGNCAAYSNDEASGETVMFWVDLSATNLIDGGFTTGQPTGNYVASQTSTPSLGALFPAAKIGRGNYVYVYTGQAWNGSANMPTGINYFGLSAITQTVTGGAPFSNPALSVQEAYAIDSKVDDGLPQLGRVTVSYLGQGGASGYVNGTPNALGAGYVGPNTGPLTGSSTTCYDNGGVINTEQHYSIEISNGSNVTCALSFQMQAGD
jgi:prepilin-type N-terminal cleavage/methylation domain-containing protein